VNSFIDTVLHPLLYVDIRSLITVLFWGNVVSFALVVSFRISNTFARARLYSRFFALGKLFQASAWLLLLFRYTLPDILSVYLGNTCLFVGFYYEARCMLQIIQSESLVTRRLCLGITVVSIILFGTAEILRPDDPAFRVAVASFCVFLTLLVPTMQIFLYPGSGHFRKTVGIFYLTFLAMLVPRCVAAFFFPAHLSVGIYSNTLVQTLTFLSQVLLLVFSFAAYLLVLREESEKMLHEMATKDALTGLPNRRTFLASAELLFSRHVDRQIPVAILVFELDEFRNVNAVWGEGFGDFFLKSFAAALGSTIRNADLPCRFRDEEFLVMLPETDAATAKKLGDEVALALKKRFLQQETGVVFTVSGGAASIVPQHGDTLEELIRQAFFALHIAKTTGANKVFVWK